MLQLRAIWEDTEAEAFSAFGNSFIQELNYLSLEIRVDGISEKNSLGVR